jgi:hypothetical protein
MKTSYLWLLLLTQSVLAAEPEKPTVDADGTVHIPVFSVPLSRYMSEEAKRQFIEEIHNPPGKDWDIDAPIAKLRVARAPAIRRLLSPSS